MEIERKSVEKPTVAHASVAQTPVSQTAASPMPTQMADVAGRAANDGGATSADSRMPVILPASSTPPVFPMPVESPTPPVFPMPVESPTPADAANAAAAPIRDDRPPLTAGVGNGMIWVGDTAEPGARKRLQREFDNIGRVLARFSIRPFATRVTRNPDIYGVSHDIRLMYRDWQDEVTLQQPRPKPQDAVMNQWVFDLAHLQRVAPDNTQNIADLFMRYERQSDGRVRPCWDEGHCYYSAMYLDELEQKGMFARPGGARCKSAFALVEERSGLVLSIPANSVVCWLYFNDGAGIEIAVCDGIAVRRRMERYPWYFDADATLSDDDIERDIAGCADVLDRLESGEVDQRGLRGMMPASPFASYWGQSA